jgi:RNA polymerase sigma-70 factor, ECF subfamily
VCPVDAEPLSDALLRARTGDEAGFLELWRALQPRLLRYLQVLGCANPGYLAGETWLQVVTKLPEFSGGEEDFRRWLFAIGRQRAIQFTPASPQGYRRAAQRVASTGVEGQVRQTLSARHALALLRRLSPDQAEAVALRALAGLDVEDAAKVLGNSADTVRAAFQWGLRTLAGDPDVRELAVSAASAAGATRPGTVIAETIEIPVPLPAARLEPGPGVSARKETN